METVDPVAQESDYVADLFDGVAKLNAKYRKPNSVDAGNTCTVHTIVAALSQFMECVRYLNTRRSQSAILSLDSEAAVQDALYLMLRPWVTDLTPENPTDKIASRFVIKDLLCPSARTVIEAKFVRNKDHGKNITKELHDDIETYRHHPQCRHLVFFIYDPDALIPDQEALARQIAIERIYNGVPLSCHLVVKP